MRETKKILESYVEHFETSISKTEKELDKQVSLKIEDYLTDLLSVLETCESPIERLFALELADQMKRSELNLLADFFDWEPQYEFPFIKEIDGKYRPDFVVIFAKQENDTRYEFAIELDGHEFHERTKEQAKRDKQKDRILLQHGIIPIRFTGSEVFESPRDCAKETINIIEHWVSKLLRW